MRPLYYTSLLLILFACQSSNKDTGINDWIKSNAHSEIVGYQYQDLIKNSKLIGIGESRHDLEEQIEARIQITKDLISQSNKFDVIIFEGSLPYGRYINEYVLGAEVDIEEVMSNMPGWFLWDTKGYMEFFKWLRTYNNSHDSKIEVFGTDIVAPRVGLTQVKSFLLTANIEGVDSIVNAYYGEEHMVDEMWMTTLRNFNTYSDTLREALFKPYNDLIEFVNLNREPLINASSESEYDLIKLIALSTLDAKNMFLATSQLETGLIRDKAMANITYEIMKDKRKGILWAHNVHVTKGPFVMSMLPNDTIKGMGHLLFQEMDESYKVIGGTFGTGLLEPDNRTFESLNEHRFEGRLNNQLESSSIFMLPASQDSTANNFFLEEHQIRGQEFEMSFIPRQSFDGFYFTKEVSKAIYNPETAQMLSR